MVVSVVPGDIAIVFSRLRARIKPPDFRKLTVQHASNFGSLRKVQIAKEIMTSTDTENVGVYIEATHGCMEHRGVMAHSSLTQTTVVHGLFHNDAVKSEFFNNVKNQMRHC